MQFNSISLIVFVDKNFQLPLYQTSHLFSAGEINACASLGCLHQAGLHEHSTKHAHHTQELKTRILTCFMECKSSRLRMDCQGISLRKEHILRPNLSTTPLRQWGFQQCLPFSWTTLRGKHCRHPIVVMGVLDTLGLSLENPFEFI